MIKVPASVTVSEPVPLPLFCNKLVTVSVLPLVTSMVPPPLPLVGPRAKPRLLLRVKLAVTCSVPPLRTILPAVTLPGSPPRFASLLIDRMPPVTVVLPV